MPDLIQRDHSFKHGVVEYRLTGIGPESKTSTQHTRLVFAEDGRMLETTTNPIYLPGTESIAYLKANDYKLSIQVTHGETTVEIEKRPGLWSRREAPLQCIEERPSLPLGLGMANHEVTATEPVNGGLRLICNREPGVKAHIDFDSSGIPESVISISEKVGLSRGPMKADSAPPKRLRFPRVPTV